MQCERCRAELPEEFKGRMAAVGDYLRRHDPTTCGDAQHDADDEEVGSDLPERVMAQWRKINALLPRALFDALERGTMVGPHAVRGFGGVAFIGRSQNALIPHRRYLLSVEDHEGEIWKHASMSIDGQAMNAPGYADIRTMRKLFFAPASVVVQVFPPEEEYVNLHPGVLHLWERLHPTSRLVPDLRRYHPRVGQTI